MYAVVAEVADGTLVSVVNVFVGSEVTCFNVESHLLIRIAERHTFSRESVDLFDREHWVVYRIVEDVLLHLHLVDYISSHLQAVFEFIEGRQESFLDDLEVAEVSHREVVHDHGDGHRQSLQFVALSSGQFEDIWVLLVRHDAGAGGAVGWEFDEAEVL